MDLKEHFCTPVFKEKILLKIVPSSQMDFFLDSAPAMALYSVCGKFRYALTRSWDESKPCVMFTMLNPSTATEMILDPTLMRCRDYATRWGYGSMIITNCYAFRSKNPQDLYIQLAAGEDIVGEYNDKVIAHCSLFADKVIVAWGTHKPISDRVEKVIESINKPVFALQVNSDFSPRHPLYTVGSSVPQSYVPAF